MISSLLSALLLLAGPEAPAISTLAIGSPAPEFDLPGVDGRRYTLKDFAKAKVLVVVFTANHCPTAQAYEERLQKLQQDYAGKGVALVAISPNDPQSVRLDELGYTDLSDSFEDMKLRAQERRFAFPYLYDGETEAVSRKYGPQATPHVFIFDAQRKLRFAGRIDDAENPEKVKVHDTRNAIDALLAEKPVPVGTTKVFGCSIKWSEKRDWVAQGVKDWAKEPVSLETVDTAALKELAKGSADKPRLINAWATWCGPCVTEFPDLVAIHRTYRGRGLEVVTVSADDPSSKEAALKFLKERQASTRNVILDTDDSYSLVEAVDPEWPGALPYTILVAPGGKILYRSVGAYDRLQLRKAIIGYLGRYYHSKPGENR
jgi:thiol-disulfide isomerase/thioredoxin